MRFLTLCCPFQVPLLDASNLGLIKPNTLVQFRGMVQDMLGNEFYVGAFKEDLGPEFGVHGQTQGTHGHEAAAATAMISTWGCDGDDDDEIDTDTGLRQ
ncbi:uncharacterized protein LOC125507073 isoform X5 [Triticum urartu]|uniref:uncharacterized protein LOC125507073 isoform X5 n=1 Tax=Triticum urartu TaxID=4572 RepID=UPI002042C05F|nr:uncharacterized protein LOC125507073 isoform X5 [Triticum urartu]